MAQFNLLGPVRINGEQACVRPRGLLRRGLLLLLITHRNQLVSRSQLKRHLWADPPPNADANIRTHLAGLRKDLDRAEPGLSDSIRVYRNSPGGGGGGVQFTCGDHGSDLDRARELFERARVSLSKPAGLDQAPLECQEALDMWKGDFAADVPDTPWFAAQAANVAELRASLRETKLTAQVLSSNHQGAILEAEELLSLHPNRGAIWALAAAAQFLGNRTIEALDRVAKCRLHFQEQGIDMPSIVSKLQRSILTQARGEVVELIRASSA